MDGKGSGIKADGPKKRQATPGALPTAVVRVPCVWLASRTAPGPGLPGSFSPSVSHHLVVLLRAWRVARSWHSLS